MNTSKKIKAGLFGHRHKPQANPPIPLGRVLPSYVPRKENEDGDAEGDGADALGTVLDVLGAADATSGLGGGESGGGGGLEVRTGSSGPAVGGGGEVRGDEVGSSGPGATTSVEVSAEAEAEAEARIPPATNDTRPTQSGPSPGATSTGDDGPMTRPTTPSIPPTGLYKPPFDTLRAFARFERLGSNIKTDEQGHVLQDDNYYRVLKWEEERGPGLTPITRIVRAPGEPLDEDEEATLMSHRSLRDDLETADPLSIAMERNRQQLIGDYEGATRYMTGFYEQERRARAARQRRKEWVIGWDRWWRSLKMTRRMAREWDGGLTLREIRLWTEGSLWEGMEYLGSRAAKYWWVGIFAIVLIVLIVKFGWDSVLKWGKKIEKVAEDIHR